MAGCWRARDAPVLVDCLATWLAAVMDEAGAWDSADGDTEWQRRLDAEVERLVEAWRVGARCRWWRSATRSAAAWSPARGPGCCSATPWAGSTSGSPTESDDVRLVVAGRVQRLTGGTA